MFNDPEINKLIIYALLGIIAVMGIALIVLGVKRNTYYVDEEGEEVTPPSKRKKKAEPKVLEEVPVSKPEPQPEPAFRIVEEPAPEPVPQETIAVERQDLKAVPTPIVARDTEIAKTLEVPVSVKAPEPKGFVASVAINGNITEKTIETLPCLLGRDKENCDLVVAEKAVSRKHARIYINDGKLYLEDVAEHNGTYLNGRKLPPLGNSPLNENDKINLGRATVVIEKVTY
ncbi:MAG: FHA domain-containing protein [Solobacterium sp.]|nr:FHA domain-containing protein [Solobacterium sp.]